MIQLQNQNEIKFPVFWKEDLVLEVLRTYDSTDLPDYFGMSISGCTKLLAQCVPNKPKNVSYKKYLSSLSTPSVPTPVVEALLYDEIVYTMPFPTKMKAISNMSANRREQWEVYKTARDLNPDKYL